MMINYIMNNNNNNSFLPQTTNINQKLLNEIFINELKLTNVDNINYNYSFSLNNNYLVIEDEENDDILVVCSINEL